MNINLLNDPEVIAAARALSESFERMTNIIARIQPCTDQVSPVHTTQENRHEQDLATPFQRNLPDLEKAVEVPPVETASTVFLDILETFRTGPLHSGGRLTLGQG